MFDTKPDFDYAAKTATKLLITQNFDSLMIDACKFNFKIPIIIDSFQNYCNITKAPLSDFIYTGCDDSYAIKHTNGQNIILYNENLTAERKQWSIVHELGHIFLNHTKDDSKEEVEAHFFAAQLLMPEIVIRYAGKINGSLSADDIYRYFNVSYESACKRVATLNKTNSFTTFSNDDRELLRKFKSIVDAKFQNQEFHLPNTIAT